MAECLCRHDMIRLVVINTKYKYTAIRLAEKKNSVRVQELRNSKENRQQFKQCLSKRTHDREETAHGQIEELWTILQGDINALLKRLYVSNGVLERNENKQPGGHTNCDLMLKKNNAFSCSL